MFVVASHGGLPWLLRNFGIVAFAAGCAIVIGSIVVILVRKALAGRAAETPAPAPEERPRWHRMAWGIGIAAASLVAILGVVVTVGLVGGSRGTRAKQRPHEPASPRGVAGQAPKSMPPTPEEEAAEHLRKLVLDLKSTDRTTRYRAVDRLAACGPEVEAAVTDIVSLLKSSDKDLRQAVVLVLGRIGQHSEQVVPALAGALARDRDPYVRGMAVWALAEADKTGSVCVPHLVRALETDPHGDVRHTVIAVLMSLGARAEGALPALRRLAASGDPSLVPIAEQAIRKIEGR